MFRRHISFSPFLYRSDEFEDHQRDGSNQNPDGDLVKHGQLGDAHCTEYEKGKNGDDHHQRAHIEGGVVIQANVRFAAGADKSHNNTREWEQTDAYEKYCQQAVIGPVRGDMAKLLLVAIGKDGLEDGKEQEGAKDALDEVRDDGEEAEFMLGTAKTHLDPGYKSTDFTCIILVAFKSSIAAKVALVVLIVNTSAFSRFQNNSCLLVL